MKTLLRSRLVVALAALALVVGLGLGLALAPSALASSGPTVGLVHIEAADIGGFRAVYLLDDAGFKRADGHVGYVTPSGALNLVVLSTSNPLQKDEFGRWKVIY